MDRKYPTGLGKMDHHAVGLQHSVEFLEEKRAQPGVATSHVRMGPHWGEDRGSQKSSTLLPTYQQPLCGS